MKNQRNQVSHRAVLILALISLMGGITLPLGSTSVAASLRQSGSGSISSASGQNNLLSLNKWSSNGPEGATILALAIDPRHPATIYAGTSGDGGAGGVFKSTDGGESWSRSLTAAFVQAVAVDPRTPTTLYSTIFGYDSLGQMQAGIRKSLNGGGSWFAVNNGLVDQAGRPFIVDRLAIDPNNPNIIYATFPDNTGARYYSTLLYKTSDGGGSWNHIVTSFSPAFVTLHMLAIDPINSNTIYACGSSFTQLGGPNQGNVFKSTDNGQSWSTFIAGTGHNTISALVIDPANPNIIYAGGEGGAYKSSDGAQSWNSINDGLGNAGVIVLAIDPGNPSIVYAGTWTGGGVFKSVNGGGNWSAVNSGKPAPYVLALVIDPVNTAIIYAGSYNSSSGDGIFKSTSGGARWSVASRGLGGVDVRPLAIDPANANTVYAGTYKSTDNGGSWTPLGISPTGSTVSALAIDPFNTATVYAGADTVYKSTNGGESWTDTGLRSYDVSTLAIDPRNSNTIYAGTAGGFFGTSGGLFKSTNAGGSWSAIGDLGPLLSLVIDPGNSNTIYALSEFSGGGCADDDFCSTVYKSADGGVTWNRSDTGTNFHYVSALAIDPINTAHIYVSGCSDNTSTCGLFKSSDDGGTWSAIGTGLIDSRASSLAIDPVNPNTIYAGGSGVFRSTDGGASWNPLNDGLPNLYINSLAIDRTGTFLHASTSAGVFDIQLSIPPQVNQIDDTQFFVRQQYIDFLNREPDAGGLAYWTDRIAQCGSDVRCVHERRIAVSAAFFIELEFQDSGYYVYRFYKASFGRQPNYAEFTSDRGKVIGGSNLEASKQAFADEWVQRPAFLAAYSNTLSNTEVVNKLFDSAGLTGSIYDAQRQQEIAAMNAGRSRALVLRDVIEISDFKNIPNANDPRYAEIKLTSQYNSAFVLMQYFGYLHRDLDRSGYDFWLDIVNNREPNNYHGMVCSFITSSEYQLRFGSSVTRSNADCSR